MDPGGSMILPLWMSERTRAGAQMLKENKSLAERKVRTPRPGPQAPFPLLVSLPGLQHPSWLPVQ